MILLHGRSGKCGPQSAKAGEHPRPQSALRARTYALASAAFTPALVCAGARRGARGAVPFSIGRAVLGDLPEICSAICATAPATAAVACAALETLLATRFVLALARVAPRFAFATTFDARPFDVGRFLAELRLLEDPLRLPAAI